MFADDLAPGGARASADTMLRDTYGTSITRLRWEASNQWPCMPPSRKVTLCLAPSTCSLHSDSVNFLKQPSSSSGLLRYFMCYCLVAPPAGISTQVKVTLDCGNLGEGNASTIFFFSLAIIGNQSSITIELTHGVPCWMWVMDYVSICLFSRQLFNKS